MNSGMTASVCSGVHPLIHRMRRVTSPLISSLEIMPLVSVAATHWLIVGPFYVSVGLLLSGERSGSNEKEALSFPFGRPVSRLPGNGYYVFCVLPRGTPWMQCAFRMRSFPLVECRRTCCMRSLPLVECRRTCWMRYENDHQGIHFRRSKGSQHARCSAVRTFWLGIPTLRCSLAFNASL